MSKNCQGAVDRVEQEAKKVYQQPQLQELGDVTEVTQQFQVSLIVQ